MVICFVMKRSFYKIHIIAEMIEEGRSLYVLCIHIKISTKKDRSLWVTIQKLFNADNQGCKFLNTLAVLTMRSKIYLDMADMRKGGDVRTLSAEVLMDCGNIKHDSLLFIFI